MMRLEQFIRDKNPWLVSFVLALICVGIQLLFLFIPESAELTHDEIKFDIVSIVEALVVAPLFETLFFQAIPIDVIKERVSNKNFVILISTLLFSLFHISSLITFISIVPLAYIYALQYYIFTQRNESAYWFTALTHALYNLVPTIQSYFYVSMN